MAKKKDIDEVKIDDISSSQTKKKTSKKTTTTKKKNNTAKKKDTSNNIQEQKKDSKKKSTIKNESVKTNSTTKKKTSNNKAVTENNKENKKTSTNKSRSTTTKKKTSSDVKKTKTSNSSKTKEGSATKSTSKKKNTTNAANKKKPPTKSDITKSKSTTKKKDSTTKNKVSTKKTSVKKEVIKDLPDAINDTPKIEKIDIKEQHLIEDDLYFDEEDLKTEKEFTIEELGLDSNIFTQGEKFKSWDELFNQPSPNSLEDTILIETVFNQDELPAKQQVTTKKVRRLRKEIIYILITIFSLIAFFSFQKIIKWEIENRQTASIVNTIKEQVKIEEVKPNLEVATPINPPTNPKDPYYDYIKTPLLAVDFTKLLSLNADTHGWLNVSGTLINYPFLKSVDNSYYLYRSFDKTRNEAGWLFLDYKNNLNYPSKNNVIYGHNRTNDTMFGTLENVLSENWYTNPDNYLVRISTPTKNMLWQVFSVYSIKNEDYYITTDFNTNEDFQTFLNTIESRSIYDFGVSLNTNDKVLTLSTCKDFNVSRTVLHAKLILTEDR